VVSRVRRFLEVLGERGGGRAPLPPFRLDGSSVREDLLEVERRLAALREVFGGEELAVASPHLEEAVRLLAEGGEGDGEPDGSRRLPRRPGDAGSRRGRDGRRPGQGAGW
jgi:hypothetical protein